MHFTFKTPLPRVIIGGDSVELVAAWGVVDKKRSTSTLNFYVLEAVVAALRNLAGEREVERRGAYKVELGIARGHLVSVEHNLDGDISSMPPLNLEPGPP